MVCSACGCEQVDGQFCRQCGARQAAPAASGPQPYMPLGGVPYGAALLAEQRLRVRQNLQPMGITWILLGVYSLFTGVVGMLVMHGLGTSGMFGGSPEFMGHLFHSLIPVIAISTLMMSMGAFLTGYALLTRQPWGRTVAIIFSILALLKLPFGTAVGVYTLWVLAPRASWAEWDAISRGA